MSLRGFGKPDFPVPVPRKRDGNALERIAASMEAIEEKYVQGPYYEPIPFRLEATGEAARKLVDTQDNRVQWLVVTVSAGELMVVTQFQDQIQPPGHLRFQITPFPWVVPLASRPYQFTLQSNGTVTTGCLILVGG
jgi:hypothetical protein